jgi:hypothetical protein
VRPLDGAALPADAAAHVAVCADGVLTAGALSDTSQALGDGLRSAAAKARGGR